MMTTRRETGRRGAGLLVIVTGIALLMVAGAVAIAEPSVDLSVDGSPALMEAAAALSPDRPATIVHDQDRGELVILHGPVDLPGSSGHGGHAAHSSDEAVFPDVSEVIVPADGHVYALHVDLVDDTGQQLPEELLHHVNLVDPDQRELFAPIAMRLAAAGRETGSKGMPPRLFGVPVKRGQRLAIHTMLHNASSKSYESVVLRFHLGFKPEEASGPLFSVHPFWVDVQLPAGDKTFDLPPGRSSKSYEAKPAISGKILALSGHAHTLATKLTFENATTGDVLWEAVPERDEEGVVVGIPIGRPFLHLGEAVNAGDTYRLTVEYDNDTGETIHDGGMGSIGGVFLPSSGAEWPAVDPDQELYQLDMKHYYRKLLGKLADLRAASMVADENTPDPADPDHVHHP